MIATPMLRTKEREHLYQWVGPIEPCKMVLYKLRQRDDLRFRGFGDLGLSRIGALRSSAQHRYLEARKVSINNIETAFEEGANLRKLKAGRMDYLLTTDMGMSFMARQQGIDPNEMERVHTGAEPMEYWFALSKGFDPKLRDRLQSALNRVKATNQARQMRAEYFASTR